MVFEDLIIYLLHEIIIQLDSIMPRFSEEQYTRWKEVIRKAGEANKYHKDSDSDSDSLPDPELYEPEV